MIDTSSDDDNSSSSTDAQQTSSRYWRRPLGVLPMHFARSPLPHPTIGNYGGDNGDDEDASSGFGDAIWDVDALFSADDGDDDVRCACGLAAAPAPMRKIADPRALALLQSRAAAACVVGAPGAGCRNLLQYIRRVRLARVVELSFDDAACALGRFAEAVMPSSAKRRARGPLLQLPTDVVREVRAFAAEAVKGLFSDACGKLGLGRLTGDAGYDAFCFALSESAEDDPIVIVNISRCERLYTPQVHTAAMQFLSGSFKASAFRGTHGDIAFAAFLRELALKLPVPNCKFVFTGYSSVLKLVPVLAGSMLRPLELPAFWLRNWKPNDVELVLRTFLRFPRRLGNKFLHRIALRLTGIPLLVFDFLECYAEATLEGDDADDFQVDETDEANRSEILRTVDAVKERLLVSIAERFRHSEVALNALGLGLPMSDAGLIIPNKPFPLNAPKSSLLCAWAWRLLVIWLFPEAFGCLFSGTLVRGSDLVLKFSPLAKQLLHPALDALALSGIVHIDYEQRSLKTLESEAMEEEEDDDDIQEDASDVTNGYTLCMGFPYQMLRHVLLDCVHKPLTRFGAFKAYTSLFDFIKASFFLCAPSKPSKLFAKLVALELSLGEDSALSQYVCKLHTEPFLPSDVTSVQYSDQSQELLGKESHVFLLQNETGVDAISTLTHQGTSAIWSIYWYCSFDPAVEVNDKRLSIREAVVQATLPQLSIVVFLSLHDPLQPMQPFEHVFDAGNNPFVFLSFSIADLENPDVPFDRLCSGDVAAVSKWLLGSFSFFPLDRSKKRLVSTAVHEQPPAKRRGEAPIVPASNCTVVSTAPAAPHATSPYFALQRSRTLEVYLLTKPPSCLKHNLLYLMTLTLRQDEKLEDLCMRVLRLMKETGPAAGFTVLARSNMDATRVFGVELLQSDCEKLASNVSQLTVWGTVFGLGIFPPLSYTRFYFSKGDFGWNDAKKICPLA